MDLFISYRRKDNFAAELIRDRLIAHDIDVFLDVHEIYQGDFRQNLEHNIDAASNFMLLLSPATWEHRPEAEIDYVREEIRIARRRNKHFILIDLPGYVEPTAAQWDAEDPDIGWLRNYDHKSFDIRSVPMQGRSLGGSARTASVTAARSHSASRSPSVSPGFSGSAAECRRCAEANRL